MGLDSYLMAEKYVSGWEHNTPAEKKLFAALLKAGGFEPEDVTKAGPSGNISINVAYWRKANHIHSWFVTHCQEGKDDCKRYYVGREKLEELLQTCQIVAADPSLAKTLLEPKSGFFFGSSDIDDWYFENLNNTIKMLGTVLANPRLEDCDFYYQSSW